MSNISSGRSIYKISIKCCMFHFKFQLHDIDSFRLFFFCSFFWNWDLYKYLRHFLCRFFIIVVVLSRIRENEAWDMNLMTKKNKSHEKLNDLYLIEVLLLSCFHSLISSFEISWAWIMSFILLTSISHDIIYHARSFTLINCSFKFLLRCL